MYHRAPRKPLLAGVVLALAATACTSGSSPAPTAVDSGAPSASSAASASAPASGPEAVQHPEITILQPQAPWLPSFEALVAAYEEETGNQVSLAVTPFDGMVQKSLNAVQADESEFDLLQLNSQWFLQFYSSGYVSALDEIDPDFELDPEIIEYAYQTRWNPETRRADENGDVFGLPINGNLVIFFYRSDLYEAAGLTCPETWDDVLANAAALHDPPEMYGWTVRTNPPILDYLTWLLSSGGDIMTYDEAADEWTVEIGSDLATETLERWLEGGRTYGPPNLAALGQPDLISLMGSGNLAQVTLVAAAAADLSNPDVSAMAGDIGACPAPGGEPGVNGAVAGIWLMGVPSNLSEERKAAAYAFMDYAMSKDAQVAMTRAGGIPTRADVYEELADDPDIGWWVSAVNESLDSILSQPSVIPGAQVAQAVTNRVSQVIAGELGPEEALDLAAEEIQAAMEDADYPMAPLP